MIKQHILRILFIIVSTTLLPGLPAHCDAQNTGKDATLQWEEYAPKSTLVVPEHKVTSARYPFIDVHSHQWQMPTQDLSKLVEEMDKLNMAVMVNLSGRYGSFLDSAIQNVEKNYPNRFIVFANINFEGIGEEGWTERAVQQLEEDVKNGANGLKIYKSLGMRITDNEGKRVPVNDHRLDPIWAKAGELGIPVLIHTADPGPFWEPHDKYNERWYELKQRPRRKRNPDSEPSWEELIAEQHHVFEKNPGTTFINAHLGWMGNDLGRLGEVMDRYPNMYTEIGAVLAELGRQPRFASKWLIKYQDRVMFGKDAWAPKEYHVYFRTLETTDEYFDYYRKRHAHWKLYGLDLPDVVLKKLYYGNALNVIPGIDESLFPNID